MTGQQARRQYALADDIHRYWRLDQCFTLFTRPFPADMAFDGEDAGRVVELFAGIFTDALDGAAALAVAVVQFVMDQRTRKLRWQRRAVLQGSDCRDLQRSLRRRFCQRELRATTD